MSDIAGALGVRVVGCHEKYLGLRSFVSRNKRSLFAHLRDRVLSRTQGWQGRLLSSAGKEVLIKSVLQAIPTYSMSLFRFPKGCIRDLHRVCAAFWWGSSVSSRKVHWGSWTKLCINKDHSGLGFRDFGAFNQALLRKQCWRILKEPSSLVARVLKSCYFPSSSLLEAKAVHSGSFMWKSLLWGRDLVVKGSR
ncbi:hypothetical protein ACOSQ3_023995 [Xanthoceras sorbifolium]